MRILIVSGLLESRLRLRNILSQAGYEVFEAESGEEAVEIAPSILPDLIFLAIVMSGVNGLETAASLRASAGLPAVRIILLGHLPPIGINEQPLASMVDGYLNADVASDELLACVGNLMR